MRISFLDFKMDQSVVAPVIYGDKPHYTTNCGVVLGKEITTELRHFLSEFNVSVGIEQTPYYRIDAYFDGESLWILEINASFVDGWGTALNLSRTASIWVDQEKLLFPKHLGYTNSIYLPELELFASELAIRGLAEHTITGCVHPQNNSFEPMYVYGRVGSTSQPNIFPYDGIRLDNKMNLGLFSRIWNSDVVKIPRHYINRFCPWEEIPEKVVLKFCDKDSAECNRANQSVLFGKPEGKAPFLKRCYRSEVLIAQDIIQPSKQNDDWCQLVILVIGNEPITGYVQYSRHRIINDNSTHGPLQIE